MRMLRLMVVVVLALASTSCATIFTGNFYSVTFDTEPEGAFITIENRARHVIYTGRTPATVPLSASAGYMRREEYKITLELPGYEPKTSYIYATLDGWYIGNILIGGWLGMLIVDPLSGAMYKIPDQFRSEPLYPIDEGPVFKKELKIIDIDNLPEDIDRDDLIPLQ